ncbi:Uncharacterized protein RNJ44_03451 [Nakaseomyces bracarensis]|uniref:Micro-fibrillar-associated protein 1 C-terminal domain-containing protein n=1 Tax=Nakaseomyces bracarensis TaxID=273131 RepID=A0ABR4NX06_9SACH
MSSDSSSGDSSSGYSSSSEEETVFHKPVLLSGNKEKEITTKLDEHVRQSILKRSIETANKLAVEKEELQRQTELNYSATDKDLLRRTMELDDDDSVDPVAEHKLWQTRQEARRLRQRELMVRKQQELESDEINRITNKMNMT